MNRLLEYLEQQKWEEEEYYLGGYEDWLAAYAAEHLTHAPKPVPCDPYEEDPIIKGRALFSPARPSSRPRTARRFWTGITISRGVSSALSRTAADRCNSP